MAYEPTVWQCGDAITADKLNKLEEGVANSGGNAGYECTETWVEVFNDTVTPEEREEVDIYGYADLEGLTATYDLSDTIKVVLNGVEYTAVGVPDEENPEYVDYGAPYPGGDGGADWSEYPFYILENNYGDSGYIEILTQTTDPYTLVITNTEPTVTTTDCFERAVKKVVDESGSSGVYYVDFHWSQTAGGGAIVCNRTFNEIFEAYRSGAVVIGRYNELNEPDYSSDSEFMQLTAVRWDDYISFVGWESLNSSGHNGIRISSGNNISTFQA